MANENDEIKDAPVAEDDSDPEHTIKVGRVKKSKSKAPLSKRNIVRKDRPRSSSKRR